VIDPAALAASGPRAAGREAAYEELMADIVAGAALHYEEDAEDADLALLQGDERYARGLATLAELGDLEATGELADLISLVAQASAADDGELVAAVWEAGAVAVGWGSSPRLQAAKRRARVGGAGAARELLEAASERRADPAAGSSAPSGI
jgi:hypothetical protein